MEPHGKFNNGRKAVKNKIQSDPTLKSRDTVKLSGDRGMKKSSPNAKLTIHIAKRDYLDHLTYTDPVDGVVVVDPGYVDTNKVFVSLSSVFCYGRQDLDVMGLQFKKELFCQKVQIYPLIKASAHHLTKLQEKLVSKLGPNAHPFSFDLPKAAPASVTLQPAPSDTGKPCGIDYTIMAYISDKPDQKPRKRDTVSINIRKLICAPADLAPDPYEKMIKEFFLSPGKLILEAMLGKEKYFHGEPIPVTIKVDNSSSSKKVKKIKLSVVQDAEIVLFNKASYMCTVSEVESAEGFPILPNQNEFNKVYTLMPLLMNNQGKRGLALDGIIKREDSNLASSTILLDNDENLGIVVRYKVVIKFVMGLLQKDLVMELPFTLTHPTSGQPPKHSMVKFA